VVQHRSDPRTLGQVQLPTTSSLQHRGALVAGLLMVCATIRAVEHRTVQCYQVSHAGRLLQPRECDSNSSTSTKELFSIARQHAHSAITPHASNWLYLVCTPPVHPSQQAGTSPHVIAVTVCNITSVAAHQPQARSLTSWLCSERGEGAVSCAACRRKLTDSCAASYISSTVHRHTITSPTSAVLFLPNLESISMTQSDSNGQHTSQSACSSSPQPATAPFTDGPP
jgi:hypothetical protein